MNKIFIILLLLYSLPSNATVLKIDSGRIAPFNARGMTVRDFIQEYAELKNIIISVQENEKLQKKINLVTYTPITINRLDNYFSQVLSGVGLIGYNNGSTIEVLPEREARYLTPHLYSSTDYPSKREFITVIHKLKYPLSNEMQHTLRGQLSRSGRFYSFASGSVVMIKDFGGKIKSMLSLIEQMDTEDAYNRLVTRMRKKAKAKSREQNPEAEKLRNKIKEFENKIKELKNNANPVTKMRAKHA